MDVKKCKTCAYLFEGPFEDNCYYCYNGNKYVNNEEVLDTVAKFFEENAPTRENLRKFPTIVAEIAKRLPKS